MHGDMRNDLPENCLATLTSTGELIVIQRGEKGYRRSEWDTGDSRENQKIADHYNQKCGINPAQIEAMQIGSMYGFHVPGANPQVFFDQAQYLRPYEISEGSTIKKPLTDICSPIEGNLYLYQVAGKDSFYLEPSAMPQDVMGITGGYVVLMDMVQGKPLIPVSAEKSSSGVWSMRLDPGSFTAGEEMNADYQIIAKVQVGPVEYALGELGGNIPFFVTWERTPANDGDGPPNYYWGNYFERRDEAVQDFCDRASGKYEMLAQSRKPSIKAQLAAKPVPGDNPVTKPKDREVR